MPIKPQREHKLHNTHDKYGSEATRPLPWRVPVAEWKRSRTVSLAVSDRLSAWNTWLVCGSSTFFEGNGEHQTQTIPNPHPPKAEPESSIADYGAHGPSEGLGFRGLESCSVEVFGPLLKNSEGRGWQSSSPGSKGLVSKVRLCLGTRS